MKNIYKKWAGLALGVVFLGMAGCGTLTPPEHANPYFGYVYSAMMQAENDQIDSAAFERAIRGYKGSIADVLLGTVTAARPAADEKRVAEWSKYVDRLNAPVRLTRDQWIGASTQLKDKQLNRLLDFWNRSADALAFSGVDFSVMWERERADARLLLAQLERERETALRKLEGFRRDHEFFEAIDILPLLETYGAIGALADEVRTDAVTYWLGLANAALNEAMNLSGAAREAVLTQTYTDLLRYRDKSAKADGFSQAIDETIVLLGENWRDRILSKGGNDDFRGAYLFSCEKLIAARRQFTPYRKTLTESIGAGYLEVLDLAQNDYLAQANQKFSEDLYGVAYVYCCMALEMQDFLVVAGMEPNAGTAERIADIQLLIEETKQRAADYFSRKLVIRDFDYDQRGLAKKVRAAAARRYEVPENDLVWALSVAAEESAEAGARDYELSGVVSDYTVERLPEVLTPMQPYERGTESMQHVSNANYKQKGLPFSESKLIWQQRVDLYPVNLVDARKKVSVDLIASCSYGGKVAQNVYELRREMADAELKSKIEGRFKQFGQPSPSPQFKINPIKAALRIGALPKNERDDLSGDSKINREMDALIVEGILSGMDRLLVNYPVEMMQKSKTARETADERGDRLGLFLMYCEQLSGAGIAAHPLTGKGYTWIHRKDLIQKNVELWLGERWSDAGDLKTEISDLWQACVKSVETIEN